MRKVSIGDIVVLRENGVRRIVVEERDEIVQNKDALNLRIAYKVAGPEYCERWFHNSEIENISPKRQ